jgi:hypothetical protein
MNKKEFSRRLGSAFPSPIIQCEQLAGTRRWEVQLRRGNTYWLLDTVRTEVEAIKLQEQYEKWLKEWWGE